MVAIKKILCPLDLSAMSPKVADYAYSMAQSLAAELTFLYVVTHVDMFPGFIIQEDILKKYEEENIKVAKEHMAKFVADHCPASKPAIEVILGNPAEEIVNRASKEKFDLIIMGTHGRTGVDHFVFGSVAEKVVKTSLVPVITIKPPVK